MDSESPLRFLDIDVSQYIYETYYPTEKARNLKIISWMTLIFGILLYSYTHPNIGTLLRYRYGFYTLLVAFGASNIVQTILSWLTHRKP